VKYASVSSWIQELKGSKRVVIEGIEDKRQITAMLTVTASGRLLPAQVIYPACIPKVTFPSDWHVTYTPYHWINEDTVLGYISNMHTPTLHSRQPQRA